MPKHTHPRFSCNFVDLFGYACTNLADKKTSRSRHRLRCMDHKHATRLSRVPVTMLTATDRRAHEIRVVTKSLDYTYNAIIRQSSRAFADIGTSDPEQNAFTVLLCIASADENNLERLTLQLRWLQEPMDSESCLMMMCVTDDPDCVAAIYGHSDTSVRTYLEECGFLFAAVYLNKSTAYICQLITLGMDPNQMMELECGTVLKPSDEAKELGYDTLHRVLKYAESR
jgi:hypothetical protein